MNIKTALYRRLSKAAKNSAIRKTGGILVGFGFAAFCVFLLDFTPSLGVRLPSAFRVAFGLVMASVGGFFAGYVAGENGKNLAPWSMFIPFRLGLDTVFRIPSQPLLEVIIFAFLFISASFAGALGEKAALKKSSKPFYLRVSPQPKAAVFLSAAWLIGALALPIYAASADFGAKWAIEAGTVMPILCERSDGGIYTSEESSEFCALNAFDAHGRWMWNFQMDGFDEVADCILSSNGTVYVSALRFEDDSSVKGMLYAVRPNGSLKWKTKFKSKGTSTLALGKDGTLYIASSGLSAFSPGGLKKWESTFEETAAVGSSAGRDGSLYVATSAPINRAQCGRESAKELQKQLSNKPSGWLYKITPNGSIEWKTSLKGIPAFAPRVSGGRMIYVATSDEKKEQAREEGRWLSAVGEDGITCWIKDCGVISGAPAIGRNGLMYFTTTSGRIYAMRADGSISWSAAVNGTLTRSMVGSDGTIYVGSATKSSDRGWLYAFKPNGNEKWRRSIGNQIVSALYAGKKDTVYLNCYTKGDACKTTLYTVDVSK